MMSAILKLIFFRNFFFISILTGYPIKSAGRDYKSEIVMSRYKFLRIHLFPVHGKDYIFFFNFIITW